MDIYDKKIFLIELSLLSDKIDFDMIDNLSENKINQITDNLISEFGAATAIGLYGTGIIGGAVLSISAIKHMFNKCLRNCALKFGERKRDCVKMCRVNEAKKIIDKYKTEMKNAPPDKRQKFLDKIRFYENKIRNINSDNYNIYK